MIPFLTPQLRAHIVQVAREWLGTAFVPHARVKGAGVDCVNLPAAILIEAGVIDFVFTGTYTIDGGRHAPASVLVRWLREDGRFEELPADPPPGPLPPLLEGDLLCFRIGAGVAHHLGLVTSPAGEFVHCLRGHGAIQSSLQDPTYRRVLTNLFRPKWGWIYHEGHEEHEEIREPFVSCPASGARR
jgi:hypothetical protein